VEIARSSRRIIRRPFGWHTKKFFHSDFDRADFKSTEQHRLVAVYRVRWKFDKRLANETLIEAVLGHEPFVRAKPFSGN
jgi:hypothetical protein